MFIDFYNRNTEFKQTTDQNKDLSYNYIYHKLTCRTLRMYNYHLRPTKRQHSGHIFVRKHVLDNVLLYISVIKALCLCSSVNKIGTL